MSRSLVFSVDYPLPADKGSKQRTVAFVDHLARRGPVDLVCYRKYAPATLPSEPFDRIHLVDLPVVSHDSLITNAIDKLVHRRPSITAPFTPAVVDAIHAFVRNGTYDLIVCRDLVNAFALMTLEPAVRAHVLVDFGDVMTKALFNSVMGSRDTRGRLRKSVERWVYLDYQRRCYSAFSHASFCSAEEADRLRPVDRRTRAHVIPNVAPMPGRPDGFRTDAYEARHRLLFIGALSYLPNIQAATWFVEQVFPALRARRREAELVVAGRAPVAALADVCSRHEGVSLVANPDDVAALYHAAGTVVVPLLEGGGTSIKVLEAGLCLRPVLSTPVGIRGLDVVAGRDVLLFDDTASFIRAFDALDDEPTYHGLSRSLHDVVEARYSASAFGAALDQVLSLVEREPG